VESEKIPLNLAQPETNGSNMDEDFSISPSPPDLLPAVSEYNSDFEDTVEEMMNQERPDSGGTVELDIIDGQSIVSFLSMEEMEKYSARHRSSSLSGSIAKTNKSSGSRRSRGKCQSGFGLATPSSSPSPYQTLEGAIGSVFSRPTTTPSPSVDNDEKGVSINIAEPSPSATDEEELTLSTPASEIDGYLIPQFVLFAVSAVSQLESSCVRSANKGEEEAPPLLHRKKKQAKVVQSPSQEADEEEESDENLMMSGVDLCEEVPVLEEVYGMMNYSFIYFFYLLIVSPPTI